MHLSYQRMKGKKGLPLFPYFGVVELGVLAAHLSHVVQ